MERTLKGFRIDPTEVPPSRELTGIVEVPDTPEGLQQATGSDLVDVVSREIGGHVFDIVIDDEGLLRQRPPSVAFGDHRVDLVGTVLVLGIGDDGDLRSLTDEECGVVMRAVHACLTVDGPRWVLLGTSIPGARAWS